LAEVKIVNRDRRNRS